MKGKNETLRKESKKIRRGTGMTEDWISAVYGFINALPSGCYDTMGMGLDILDGIKEASENLDAIGNQYIRGIRAGG